MREKQIKRSPRSQKFEVFDHFLGYSTANSAFWSPYNFQNSIQGAGAGFTALSGDALNPGVIRLLTGTADRNAPPQGKTGMVTSASIPTGGANIEIEFVFRPTVISNVNEDYEFYAGFIDRSIIVPTTGAYIYFDWSNNPNNFIACFAKNNNVVTSALSTAVLTTNWMKVNIKIPKGAGSAIFTFNDTLITTLTTNIPSVVGVGFQMTKYAGTVNQGFDLDYSKFTWSI